MHCASTIRQLRVNFPVGKPCSVTARCEFLHQSTTHAHLKVRTGSSSNQSGKFPARRLICLIINCIAYV